MAALLSSDGTNASAVVTSPALGKTSSGYLGTSDGWTDLATDHDMDWSYDATARGNVVQTGRVKVNGLQNHQRFTVSIGFGSTETSALSTAQASLGAGFAAARTAYDRGWAGYLGSLDPVPTSASAWTTEWKVSAMVLAGSEDKTVRGGFVAAPTRPWAWANSLQFLAVYHAVWSRDLYQIATGLLAIGDDAAANRALDFLWSVQQRPDGSFPQNSRLDGDAGVRRPADGRGGVPDRARAPARPDRPGRLGQREALRRLRGRERPEDPAGAVGERRPATRRRPSPPRSPAWSAPRTSRRRTATTARPRPTWRRPTSGSRRSSR